MRRLSVQCIVEKRRIGSGCVWHHRSDGSRNEASNWVWGSVHGKGYFWRTCAIVPRRGPLPKLLWANLLDNTVHCLNVTSSNDANTMQLHNNAISFGYRPNTIRKLQRLITTANTRQYLAYALLGKYSYQVMVIADYLTMSLTVTSMVSMGNASPTVL